ncbi:MAG: chemotaxis protein CheX [Chthoniobacterales bacterium]|nr:chemotaxis protein CheX [Chthoniobacterales bacterium]
MPETELLRIINKSVPEIFQTMAGMKTEPRAGLVDAPRPSILQGITGSVSLSGKASGVVYTAFSLNLASKVASNVLGMSDLSENDVSDVIGEFTNMITGNLKSQLADNGYPCQLSIPTVMRGREISVVAKNAPICVSNTFYFPAEQEELTVLVFAKFD